MALYAGIDLGATHLRAAVADGDGTVVGDAHRETPDGNGGEAVTASVLATLRDACKDAAVDPEALREVGIASVGPFDPAGRAVVGPSNLDVDRVPLVDPVADATDAEAVRLLNDCAAGALGERFSGDDPPSNLVYLTISTGIGAGVVVDGRLLHGWHGNVAEVGHWVVDPDGRRTCGDGKPGHWEAYCSGENVPAYAREVHEETGLSTDLPLSDPDLLATTVLEAGDDPLGAAVAERVARWNALGVTNLVHAYAPSVVAVGGAVALHSPAAVLDPLRERVPEMVITAVPEIRLAAHGEEAVLRGAVAAAIHGT